ncbi:MAG: NAD(P)H-dependent oxidoreductase subunit E [Gammaproteobacteria bacterium]|nr:NAD(P)H-dependent oxidoreductase subunit E [Gammaproteobacteria bacterium]NNK98784.1 NADP oxidoreductase [Xanthomonadales bacterium]
MPNIEEFIGDIFSEIGEAPDLLLQYLHAIQHEYSHVPEEAIQLLSERLKTPPMKINAVIDFYSFLHRTARGEYDIRFSDNITDRMLGNQLLFKSLCKKLGVEPDVPRADGKVTVSLTSCTGICDQGPAMLVNGLVVSKLTEKRIHKMVGRIEAGIPVANWPKSLFVVKDNIRRKDKLLNDDIIKGSAIGALAATGGEVMLERLENSGLRGRGGAGFGSGLKWRLCRETEADKHYVVCNADEGEPGTFKDRVLLNSYADELFEGMTVAAGIVGAKKGLLYLRREYLYMREALEKTLQERREAKLLGKKILGHKGFNFDIEIHMGAGAYICGEESALIESLEGKRGIPRDRPPFPVTCGYKNKPTALNNVETFVAAAKIAVFGADWYHSVGTSQSSGTKLLSISGDCERPGIYEYPFGVTIRQILVDCGASDTQAVQVSGAAGSTIPPQEFYRKIAFEDVSSGGSFMIFNQQRDLLKMVLNFARFFTHESCGFCTPCRVGGRLLNDLVEKVMVGYATRYDLKEMERIGQVMKKTAHCGLGSTAPNPILDTLAKFPGIYATRLHNTSHTPAFDMTKALDVSRLLTGREDEGAYVERTDEY